ncbi:MAG: DUF4838 domain-containing protein [Clostridia bacterium]|nr:DUF4838 domain-containing protein [Clostridia bacterium]
MKRILSLLLLVMIAASSVVVSFGATSDGNHGFLCCDANDDGYVNMKDVLLIRRFISNIVSAKAINILSADVNSDSLVDMKDVIAVRRVISGLADTAGNNTDGKCNVNTITVCGRNISRYDILIPYDADECMEFSSDQLRKYIRIACGINLNITKVRDPYDKYYIEYVKDTEDKYGLGLEGYNVKVKDDGDVLFTCGTLRGSLYVTYYFLEKFIGWRFLNDDVDYLYKADNIDIPAGTDETEVPGLSYRALNQIGSTSNDFDMLRLNGVDSLGSYSAQNLKYGGGEGTLHAHGHSYAYQMAGWEYAYDNKSIEEMGLFNTQPCLTAEETYEKFIEFNRQLYYHKVTKGGLIPGVQFTMISCSPNDNIKFCDCSRCKAVYNQEGSISGTVIRMSNRIAEAQREEMPGVGVFTIAYWDARNAPKVTRPDDDVCVCFCVGGCNNHTFDKEEECAACGGNARYNLQVWDIETSQAVRADFNVSNVYDLDCYSRWTQLTNNIFVWYYACNFSYLISPCPNVLNIYNDYKYLAETGTIGVYTEGSERGNTFEVLRGYLASRMMWDPYMSEEEFEGYLDEFLMIYYGEGWEYIKEYIYMQDACGNLKGCFMNNFDRPWDFYDKGYFAANYDHMLELFDNAYAAAEDEDQRERIKLARIHVYFLGLSATYESNYVNGTSEQRSKYAQQYAYLWDLVNTEGFIDKTRENGFKCTEVTSGISGLSNFPSSPDNIYDTMRWIFDDFTGTWEDENN